MAGQIYASESDLMHYPQPLAQKHTERWTGLMLDSDITHPDAIALRGMFGNQKTVLEKVHALLVGKAGCGRTASGGSTPVCDSSISHFWR